VWHRARDGRRYLPYAFTERGVATLSGVFRRKNRTIQVNPVIMRAFVKLREITLCSQGPGCKTSGCDRLILGSRRRGFGGTKRARALARAGGAQGSSIDVNIRSLRIISQGNLVRPQG